MPQAAARIARMPEGAQVAVAAAAAECWTRKPAKLRRQQPPARLRLARPAVRRRPPKAGLRARMPSRRTLPAQRQPADLLSLLPSPTASPERVRQPTKATHRAGCHPPKVRRASLPARGHAFPDAPQDSRREQCNSTAEQAPNGSMGLSPPMQQTSHAQETATAPRIQPLRRNRGTPGTQGSTACRHKAPWQPEGHEERPGRRQHRRRARRRGGRPARRQQISLSDRPKPAAQDPKPSPGA